MVSRTLRTQLAGALLFLAGCAAPHADLSPVPQGAEKILTFALIADPHIGDGVPAYAGEENAATQRLRAAVEHVNALAPARGIERVFVLGDVTQSAEPAEFAKAREILDELSVPYLPLLGNHDVWVYTAAEEASLPRGDQLFWETFGDLFAGLEATGGERIFDPVQGVHVQLQNVALRVGPVLLLGLDWNTRQHAALTYPGSHPQAELHDYKGGTLPWLRRQLENLEDEVERVFFLQHHPFRMLSPIPEWIYGFDADEQATFQAVLAEGGEPALGGAVFAGHQHVEAQTSAFASRSRFLQIETAACKDRPAVTLVDVYAGGAFSITRTSPPAPVSLEK